MKEVRWFREVIEREESKTKSFEKSRLYLQWLIDKYNKLIDEEIKIKESELLQI